MLRPSKPPRRVPPRVFNDMTDAGFSGATLKSFARSAGFARSMHRMEVVELKSAREQLFDQYGEAQCGFRYRGYYGSQAVCSRAGRPGLAGGGSAGSPRLMVATMR